MCERVGEGPAQAQYRSYYIVQGAFFTGSLKSFLCIRVQTKLVSQYFAFVSDRGNHTEMI